MEIPVTTLPVLKTPFHFSYLLYLAGYSESLMMFYLKVAVSMCRMTGTEPSFLLHPLDVIGADQVEELGFFPGMDKTGAYKTELLVKVITKLQEHLPAAFASAMTCRCGFPRLRRSPEDVRTGINHRD